MTQTVTPATRRRRTLTRGRKAVAAVLGFVLVAGAGAAVAAYFSEARIGGSVAGEAFAVAWTADTSKQAWKGSSNGPVEAPLLYSLAGANVGASTATVTTGALTLGTAGAVGALPGERFSVTSYVLNTSARKAAVSGLVGTPVPGWRVSLVEDPANGAAACGTVIDPGKAVRTQLMVEALGSVAAGSTTLPADLALTGTPLKASSTKTNGQTAVAADYTEGVAPACSAVLPPA